MDDLTRQAWHDGIMEQLRRSHGLIRTRMMPGQTPYTEAEQLALNALISDACDQDKGEAFDPGPGEKARTEQGWAF